MNLQLGAAATNAESGHDGATDGHSPTSVNAKTRMKTSTSKHLPKAQSQSGCTPSYLPFREEEKLSFETIMNLAEVDWLGGLEDILANIEVPQYIQLRIALDSGTGAHLINRKSIPGGKVSPSAVGKAGALFLGADGSRIANYGGMMLELFSHDPDGQGHQVAPKFEDAGVTGALWSVGLICDKGLNVDYKAERATISDKGGKDICVFEWTNWLYVATVMVDNPLHEDFHRQGA